MQVESVMEERRGMIVLKRSSLQSLVHCSDSGPLKPASQQPRCRRKSTDHEIRQEADVELRLCSGSTFRVELTGDVEVVADDGCTDVAAAGDQLYNIITFHQLVGRCCRQFTIVPKPSSVDADGDAPKVSQSTGRVSNKRSPVRNIACLRIIADFSRSLLYYR